MLVPFLAETSRYGYLFCSLYCYSYFLSTSLSAISDLLPTKNMRASCPLDSLTKSSHLSAPSNDDLRLTSMTMRHASASLTYDGIRERNLYCPAVSHSCIRRVSPSTCMVFVTKSIPTVGCIKKINTLAVNSKES